MCTLRHASLILLVTFTSTALAKEPQGAAQSTISGVQSRNQQAVTGPREIMNAAIAGGATAVISMKPVPPKTVPASNYPMGTVIMNETIVLGSVPARVWLELQATGWAPECAKILQVKIDAEDQDMDGGGYAGANADCDGAPFEGAGDLFPAIVPCTSHLDCRSMISGRTSACFAGEPSRCVARPAFFPPGGNVCEFGFYDRCHPQWAVQGLPDISATDISTINCRLCFAVNSPEPSDCATDFHTSYVADLVLDVPANAKGDYRIDFNQNETFMLNGNPAPDNQIPIAAFNVATISVSCCDCDSHADCDDNDACTIDSCDLCVCTNAPVAGWNQATECCHPMNGMQAPIPQSTSCRTGGCSLGNSSGTPTLTNLPNLTPCESLDPCYSGGQCNAGQCIGEQYAGSDCPKPRFISFDVSTGPIRAYRVRLVSLHHPNPPYTGGGAADFSSYEGEVRWVGPPDLYIESSADSTPVYASFIQCQPHYANWGAEGDLLHVSGAEIVPSSVYEVQSITEGLDINVESNYSAPITIATARWADVIIPYSPPNTTAQPNAGDHAALVDKFRGGSSAMSKPRALLVGMDAAGIPSLVSDVSFAEISAAVDAFKGRPYPFTGPAPCP